LANEDFKDIPDDQIMKSLNNGFARGHVIVAEIFTCISGAAFFASSARAQRLSLEVRDGDFFALVGQNGAGKSTPCIASWAY